MNAENARFLAIKGTPVVLICSDRTEVLGKYFASKTLWLNEPTEREILNFLTARFPEIAYEKAQSVAKTCRDMRKAMALVKYEIGQHDMPSDGASHAYNDCRRALFGKINESMEFPAVNWVFHNSHHIDVKLEVLADFTGDLVRADHFKTNNLEQDDITPQGSQRCRVLGVKKLLKKKQARGGVGLCRPRKWREEIPNRILKASKFHHKELKQLECTLLQQDPVTVADSVITGGEEYSFNQMARKRARLNKDYLTTCWVPREDDDVVPVKQEPEEAEVKQAKPDKNKQEAQEAEVKQAKPDENKQEAQEVEVKQAKPDKNKQEVSEIMLEPSAATVPDTGGSNSSGGSSAKIQRPSPVTEEVHRRQITFLDGSALWSHQKYSYTVATTTPLEWVARYRKAVWDLKQAHWIRVTFERVSPDIVAGALTDKLPKYPL